MTADNGMTKAEDKQDYHATIERVRKWAADRNIETFSTPEQQFKVTLEEIQEVQQEFESYRNGDSEMYELLSEIGDVIFTLEVIVFMLSPKLNGLDCLKTVCTKNEKRTGGFNEAGKWVKDGSTGQ